MFTVEPAQPAELETLKLEYVRQAVAPLDGMWLVGFLPGSAHFGIYSDKELVGYCCVNDDGYLLQFYLPANDGHMGSALLKEIVEGKHARLPLIKGAFVSTAEPTFVSTCLDCFSQFDINGFMYQLDSNTTENNTGITLENIEKKHLGKSVDLVVNSTGADATWAAQYNTGLIDRSELLGLWSGDDLLGVGEYRPFHDVQKGYVDLGVIVQPGNRGKGLATSILRELVNIALRNGLKPMCSTERDNFAAQKAITRAGFRSQHRIIEFRV